MRFLEMDLKGVILVEPDVFRDARGFFMETYHAKKYMEGGISGPFVQDNLSRSVRGTIRGLHYQLRNPQGKLVSVITGVVFDVTVDIRTGSPTFGKWVSVELSADNRRQLYIPPGFAHGFCVLSETADITYKCTDFYAPEDDRGIIWNDRHLGIPWPVTEPPLLSPKDRSYKSLSEMSGELPVYQQ